MRRREVITGLAGAVGWPVVARAQRPGMPIIGLLGPTAPDAFGDRLRGFHRGLKQAGYIESENVTILYRWAEGQFDLLPTLASELARHGVALIAAGATNAAFAAKAATSTIPVLFVIPEDPVRLGLLANIARPEANITGVNLLTAEVAAKRLALLRQLIPGATHVAALVNPADTSTSKSTLREVETAAQTMGLQVEVALARTRSEIDAVFADFALKRPDVLFLGNDPFFTSRRVQLANLASRHAIPMSTGTREITEVGGLMSYGANIPDAWRQVGIYAGRILKGTKPADLPVMQATKLELVINAQTARTLGVAVPSSLLALADEVIE